MHKPIIGITQSSSTQTPITLHNTLKIEAYLLAIQNAGGDPIMLCPESFPKYGQSRGTALDGILLSGGGDINPAVYGAESNPYISGIDDLRDSHEIRLLHLAMAQQIPFLGICRGLQLINVALGGTLYCDIYQELPSACDHDRHPSRKYLAHTITLAPENPLHMMGYISGTSVNSLHHQGIREVGNGLKPIAWSADGLIEAIELTGHRFGLAVQWHPEWLTEQVSARSLFKAFIKVCG
ncbi:MAG: gamma-glutamyl-gamma-aminobutyrate hydrolase family protein [Anaerolineaceae bacterium]|nr:gamma-glutamyl-gamma-aminobutyrate hydrolase family protein [Anaerolineaceae bacterium]MBN2677891.1 gamma-glutamyl-gamma-aminobutyrate hydrolase family protein [Anaerolineaceae bacterium]